MKLPFSESLKKLLSLCFEKFYLDIYFIQHQIMLYTQGSVAVAGDAVKWLRDGLGLIKKSSDIGERLCLQLDQFFHQ